MPVANVADLQLDREVLEAVSGGRFHIWEVATIEQGIELLTGVPAGRVGGPAAAGPRAACTVDASDGSRRWRS